MNDPVQVPKRKSLTRLQRAKIFDAAHGTCHICTRKIHPGEKWEADHIQPRELTGSDGLDEFAPAHVDCHKSKTKEEDLPRIKKVRRTRAKHLGIRKRRRKRIPYRKFDGTPIWPRDDEIG